MAPADLAQPDSGAGTSVGRAPPPLLVTPADGLLLQATAIHNAALGTVTATDEQEVRDGDNAHRHDTRRRDGEQRDLRFNQPPPRPAESSFRPGSQEYRNAREARLLEFAG